MTVASKEMTNSRNQAMARMWREEQLCDCKIRVDGRVFPAHRMVLATCSTFMRSAFTIGLSETATASVALDGIEATVFEAVLDFIYTGTCTFDESRALAMLHAATWLGIPLLETEMASHINMHIDPATCLEVWRAGDALSLPEMAEAARRCVEEAFVEVAAGDGWLGAAAPWLECLLVSDELAVETEEQVFEALMRWYTAQRPPPSHELLDRLLALAEQGHRTTGHVENNRSCPRLLPGHYQAAPSFGQPRPISHLRLGPRLRCKSARPRRGCSQAAPAEPHGSLEACLL